MNIKQLYDVPERTGKGDAMRGVMSPFVAGESSSSSSGNIVSSDCVNISHMRDQGRTVLTRGFFFGFRFEDLRRPLIVMTGADGVVASALGVAVSMSSFSSDATSS
jgi:hypothetical protein